MIKILTDNERVLRARTRLLVDKWRVTERISTNQKNPDRNRVVVEIWYDGRCVFESHGRVALVSALENVKRWAAIGHVPVIPKGKVLADYPTQEARDRAARKYASGVVKGAPYSAVRA